MFSQHKVPREADFTDLAELISRIDDPQVSRKKRDSHFYIGSDLGELRKRFALRTYLCVCSHIKMVKR